MKISDLFKSKGVKRNLAALIASIASAALVIHPEFAVFAPVVVKIIGALGFTGLVQAAATGNLTIKDEGGDS